MATWVRSIASTLATQNASIDGPVTLDNDTAPADFDPAGVTAVRIQATLDVQSGDVRVRDRVRLVDMGDMRNRNNRWYPTRR